jgi:hypothetical protein
MTSRMASCDVYRYVSLFYFCCFRTLNLYLLSWAMVCNNLTLKGNLDLNRCCTLDSPSVSFNAYVRSSICIPSDLPGVNPATNDRMILYYCLMTKVDWFLGDSTVFSWAGCHIDLLVCVIYPRISLFVIPRYSSLPSLGYSPPFARSSLS